MALPYAQGSLAFFFASDPAYWPGVLLRGAGGLSDALQWTTEGISDIFDISHVVLSQASSLAKNLLYTSALAKANECGQSQKSVSELKMGETTEYYSWIKSSTGHQRQRQ